MTETKQAASTQLHVASDAPKAAAVDAAASFDSLFEICRNQEHTTDQLGEAIYGDVVLGCNKKTRDLVAIKRHLPRVAVHRMKAKPDTIEDDVKEAQFLQHLPTHENIVGFRGHFQGPCGIRYTVLEYCNGGDLFEAIVDHDGHLDRTVALSLFRQLLQGLDHAHAHGVAFRDVSAENCLLVHADPSSDPSEQTRLVLCDFGLAVKCAERPLEKAKDCAENKDRSKRWNPICPLVACCGKQGYLAPEALDKNQKTIDVFKMDMFAAGVVLFLLLCKLPPFRAALMTDARYHCIASGSMLRMISTWGVPPLEDKVAALLTSLLSADPTKRPSAYEALRGIAAPLTPA